MKRGRTSGNARALRGCAGLPIAGNWSWTLLLVALVFTAGCPRPQPERPRPANAVAEEVVAGLRVATVPAALFGRVRLHLWVDAGSLDAADEVSSAVALMTAWAAAGEGIEVEVLPHGTHFLVDASEDELPAALARLGSVLQTPELGADEHALLHRRLRIERRRARSQLDFGQTLAAVALLGTRVDPFGEPARDESLRREAIGDFFAEHYGVGRLLLVAEGEVSAEELRRLAERHLDAQIALGSRGDAPPCRDGVSEEYATTSQWTVAGCFDSPERAEAAAQAFGQGHRFSLRGRHLAMVSLGSEATAEAALRRGAIAAMAGGIGEQPLTSARSVALRWLNTTTEPRTGEAGHPAAFAIAHLGAEEQPELEPWFDLLRASLAPTHEDGVLENGARVQVHAQAGTTVALALRIAEPATAVPAQRAGRRNAYLHFLAQGCRASGVPVQPGIDPDGWHLMLEVPLAHWRRELQRLVQCALEGPREAMRLEENRAVLLRGALAVPERSWVAEALAPGSPAMLAPGGTTLGLAQPFSLEPLREHFAGAHVSIALLGPVELDAIDFAAALLSRLPGDADAMRSAALSVPVPAPSPRWDEQDARLGLGWRSEASGPAAALAAQLFAERFARHLERRGWQSRWWSGDASGEDSWALLGVSLPAEDAPAIPEVVAQAQQSALRDARGRLAEALDALREHQRSPLRRLGHLLRWPGGSLPTQEDLAAALLSFETAAPTVVLGQRPPEPVRRHRRRRRRRRR